MTGHQTRSRGVLPELTRATHSGHSARGRMASHAAHRRLPAPSRRSDGHAARCPPARDSAAEDGEHAHAGPRPPPNPQPCSWPVHEMRTARPWDWVRACRVGWTCAPAWPRSDRSDRILLVATPRSPGRCWPTSCPPKPTIVLLSTGMPLTGGRMLARLDDSSVYNGLNGRRGHGSKAITARTASPSTWARRR